MVAVTPLGCRLIPEIVGECDATITRRADIMTIVNHILKGLYLVVMVGIMGVLYWHVLSQNRLHSVQKRSDPNQRDSVVPTNESDGIMDIDALGSDSSDDENQIHSESQVNNSVASTSISQQRALNETTESQANLEYLSNLYRNETALQGILYIAAYLTTYVPTIVVSFNLILNGSCPRWLQVTPYIFNPLGGFFFMLVYTRPQIGHLRRANPSLSRVRGFWLVLKAGGEVPEEPGDIISSRHRNRVLRSPRRDKRQRGSESISSVQIGAMFCESSKASLSDAPMSGGRSGDRNGGGVRSSIEVLNSNGPSLQEGDLNYNPESKWSYVKGGSEVPRSGAGDSSEYDFSESIPPRSSIEVFDGAGPSLQEGDLNYNPESQWSYVEGGSSVPRSSAEPESALLLDSGLSIASNEDD